MIYCHLDLAIFCCFGVLCAYGLCLGAKTTKPSPVESDGPVKILKDGILSVPPVTPPKEHKDIASFDFNKDKSTVSITVVGASGDLAKKKIFPALFALYYEGCLPEV